MSDFISNWGNVTKILQMLQAVYSKHRFSDVCEFLKDDLCSRCRTLSWNKEHVTHAQEVVCSVVADGRDNCRKDQKFVW
jgi:hypothetical protein